jgi:hypothetical protein
MDAEREREKKTAEEQLRQEQLRKQQEQLMIDAMIKEEREAPELEEFEFLKKQTILGSQGVARLEYLKTKYPNKTRITRKRKNRKSSSRMHKRSRHKQSRQRQRK